MILWRASCLALSAVRLDGYLRVSQMTWIDGNASPAPSFIKPKIKTRIYEDELQAEACLILDSYKKKGIAVDYAGDMNAGKRGFKAQALAKRTGMRKGEPDLRIYLDGAITVMIEFKVKGHGSVSKDQKKRHAELEALGFDVRVWRMKLVSEVRPALEGLLREYYGPNAV